MKCSIRIVTCYLLGLVLMGSMFFYSSIIKRQQTRLNSTSISRSLSLSSKNNPFSRKLITPTKHRRKDTESSLPILLLHIGPRKTASSVIQGNLFKSKPYLSRDSFVYFQRENGLCMYATADCPTSKQREFEDKLQALRLSGTNVILSDENFSYVYKNKEKLIELQNKLLGWDVRVVVVYRRYFDWLLSEYDQEAKRGSNVVNMNMATLIDYYKHIGKNHDFAPCDVALINRWKQVFDDIHIFNLHDNQILHEEGSITALTNALGNASDQLFTRFMCQAIPEAYHTCEALKSGTFIPSSMGNMAKNKVSAEALLLTLNLMKRQLINIEKNDKKMFLQIADVLDQYLSSHYAEKEKPLNCLSSNELDEILSKSISDERMLLPNFHQSENGALALRSLFNDAVKKNKFCQLDVTAFLEEEEGNLSRKMLLYLKRNMANMAWY